MNASPDQPSPSQPRLLTFASAGWVFVLAAVLILGIILWQVTYILPTLSKPVQGDGRTVESYGFDLSNLNVPRDLIAASGFAKDGLPPLIDPLIVVQSDLAAIHRQLRSYHIGKALVDDELVIGVEINGQARAYPLRILALHEIFADTLGVQPILVTYSPLTDSAVVFDRHIDGELHEFGISGLLYNSNTLFYDQHPDPNQQSLWSQLAFQAISGPAAGTELTLLPFQVMPWGAWHAKHPDTTAVLPRNDFKRYKRVSYTMYYGVEKIHYPVRALPSDEGPTAFTPILAVPGEEAWQCVSLTDLVQAGGDEVSDISQLNVNGLKLNVSTNPVAAWIEKQEQTATQRPAIRALWFAWHAMHGERSELIELK